MAAQGFEVEELTDGHDSAACVFAEHELVVKYGACVHVAAP